MSPWRRRIAFRGDLSQGGTIISETVRVQFPGNCQQNLALVNFAQTRDF